VTGRYYYESVTDYIWPLSGSATHHVHFLCPVATYKCHGK